MDDVCGDKLGGTRTTSFSGLFEYKGAAAFGEAAMDRVMNGDELYDLFINNAYEGRFSRTDLLSRVKSLDGATGIMIRWPANAQGGAQ